MAFARTVVALAIRLVQRLVCNLLHRRRSLASCAGTGAWQAPSLNPVPVYVAPKANEAIMSFARLCLLFQFLQIYKFH